MDPEQTRDALLKTLKARQPDIDVLYRYYRGEHPLPWAPREVRESYRLFLRMARSNWCRLVVKATAERLRVVGLRFSDETDGDTEVWKQYWQANNLDAQSRMVHDAALVARRGFTLVWPQEGGGVSITPEHPSQCIVDYFPGTHKRRSGLKMFSDPTSKMAYCQLWTPDQVFSWSARTRSAAPVGLWVPWEDDDLAITPEADNPIGDVPLVEFVADPDMILEPLGELDGGVLDIQDRINKTILDRLVSSNFQSFKQRWVTGLEIPKDAQGNDIEPFKAAADHMFFAENPDARFGEFTEADLKGYIASVEADIQHLAAITRTPPHYLLGQSGAFPSGQSLKATETGLVAKVEERSDSFTESWEETIRLALKAGKDSKERWKDMALSMLWKDPESHSLTELYDSSVKAATAGVPWRERMVLLGYSPTDIDRMEAERAEDQASGLFTGDIAAPSPKRAPVPAS